MRWHSTPESAIKGEITKLAIIECFASIAVYIAIGYWRHTFAHYVWAIALAPLALFRTDEASLWSLDVIDRVIMKAPMESDDESVRGLFSFLLFVIFLPCIGIALRFCGTAYWLLRAPLHTISQMPGNWIRQCLCTDIFHVPEVLPLEATRSEYEHVPRFTHVLLAYKDEEKLLIKALGSAFILPLLLLGFVPSAMYRVTFKATALVYAPFVWIAHTSLGTTLSIKTRLERFTKGEMEKVRRGFSACMLGIVAIKVAIVLGWLDVSQLLSRIPSPKLVSSFVQPAQFPWWQGTLVIDSLVTYAIFFIADAALARLDEKAWSENTVLNTISGLTFTRNVLAILTVTKFCSVAVLETIKLKVK